jgi:hypothetical protein
MRRLRRMKRYLLLLAAAAVAALTVAAVALAQSGHFVGTPVCEDIGTQLECSGKVAGLGGTTFEITVEAAGTASVECTNPGGNVAPGQDFDVTATGSGGPQPTPRNGQARFTIRTDAPSPPADSCPNESWTAEVVDVAFTGDATLRLFEDSNLSDIIVVPIS